MFQIMQEAVGLDDEADEIGDGGDDDEGSSALFDQKDIKHQHDDGEEHFDAFVEVKPALAADLFVEVFLHQRAVERPEDHVEVRGRHHPVVPPFLLTEEAEEDADDKKVGE